MGIMLYEKKWKLAKKDNLKNTQKNKRNKKTLKEKFSFKGLFCYT